MSDPQKYTIEQMEGFPPGFTYVDGYDHLPVGTELITYSSHLAAIKEAKDEAWQRGAEWSIEQLDDPDAKHSYANISAQYGYGQGQMDERNRILAGIEALPDVGGKVVVYLSAVLAVIEGAKAK
jgi:hypothetical protein